MIFGKDRLRSLKNVPGIDADLEIRVGRISSVAHQSACTHYLHPVRTVLYRELAARQRRDLRIGHANAECAIDNVRCAVQVLFFPAGHTIARQYDVEVAYESRAHARFHTDVCDDPREQQRFDSPRSQEQLQIRLVKCVETPLGENDVLGPRLQLGYDLGTPTAPRDGNFAAQPHQSGWFDVVNPHYIVATVRLVELNCLHDSD
jgi:hypothetical protein